MKDSERAQLLELLDGDVRQKCQFPGRKVEHLERVIRVTGPTCDKLDNLVFWSDLDGSNACREIEAQVRHFESIGHDFEWIVYGYDRPADLVALLLDHGFEHESEEEVVVAESEKVAECGDVPPGIELRVIEDTKGIGDLMEVQNAVWGEGHRELITRWLTGLIRDQADESLVQVAYDDGKPVGASWALLEKGRPFALLFGGSVRPGWRRRGIYNAMVATRASEAVRMGHRWCLVDAGAESRPILERVGFRGVTTRMSMRWTSNRG